MAGLLDLSGLDWSVPDFSTLSRRQKTLDVTIPYHGSKGPLHLLVDSTGIKLKRDGEGHSRWHGVSKRRVRRKTHIGADKKPLEISAIEVTSSNVGGALMLPEFPKQIGPDQEIATVTADGACDTRACNDTVAARGAAAFGHSFGPVAVMPSVPPRRTARPWTRDTAGARTRNEILRASRHLGRALWRNWSGVLRRSGVENTLNCVKLFGQRLMARDLDRQVAEVQIRSAAINRFTALGIPPTVAQG